MAKLIDAWRAVSTDNDRGAEGGTVGFFTYESTADKAAVGYGYWGGNGRAVPCRLLVVEDRFYVLDKSFPDGLSMEDFNKDLIDETKNKVAAAKAKLEASLTPEEIKLLGLKE